MKLGFIGARNMAKAMIGGILKNNIFKPEEVIASDLYEPGLRQAKESLGIHVTTDNKEVARTAEVLVLSRLTDILPAPGSLLQNIFQDTGLLPQHLPSDLLLR